MMIIIFGYVVGRNLRAKKYGYKSWKAEENRTAVLLREAFPRASYTVPGLLFTAPGLS